MANPDLPPSQPGVPAHELRLILPDERARFDQELCMHHYLHNATLVGETLRCVAVAPDGRWLVPPWRDQPRVAPSPARSLARLVRAPARRPATAGPHRAKQPLSRAGRAPALSRPQRPPTPPPALPTAPAHRRSPGARRTDLPPRLQAPRPSPVSPRARHLAGPATAGPGKTHRPRRRRQDRQGIPPARRPARAPDERHRPAPPLRRTSPVPRSWCGSNATSGKAPRPSRPSRWSSA